ncbi:hypothetical protein DXG03_005470 [Asterophora parasitica]|uniref:Uncharacterized protein n=1 Tax=Asterophora parasitica TaxID=117018 RepID=A0A9P7G6C8_9AGAR|nr:hypothetical protein DXG03_005470 [Asterophora parasitica]
MKYSTSIIVSCLGGAALVSALPVQQSSDSALLHAVHHAPAPVRGIVASVVLARARGGSSSEGRPKGQQRRSHVPSQQHSPSQSIERRGKRGGGSRAGKKPPSSHRPGSDFIDDAITTFGGTSGGTAGGVASFAMFEPAPKEMMIIGGRDEYGASSSSMARREMPPPGGYRQPGHSKPLDKLYSDIGGLTASSDVTDQNWRRGLYEDLSTREFSDADRLSIVRSFSDLDEEMLVRAVEEELVGRGFDLVEVRGIRSIVKDGGERVVTSLTAGKGKGATDAETAYDVERGIDEDRSVAARDDLFTRAFGEESDSELFARAFNDEISSREELLSDLGVREFEMYELD